MDTSLTDLQKRAKPETEDPYEDSSAISSRIDEIVSEDNFQRARFERSWFRNILYIAGLHYIIWDKAQNTWRHKRLPRWYPRAQTNKIAEKYNDLVAQLLQSTVPIRYVPATNDADDAAMAEIGERVREVFREETKIETKEGMLASWFVATGNAFLLSYYDTDPKYGMSPVQASRCVICQNVVMPSQLELTGGFCPYCAEQEKQTNAFIPAVESGIDGDNVPINEEFPIGALQSDVLSPFELRIDFRVSSMEEQRRFVRLRRYDLEYAKDTWPEYADHISPEERRDISQFYLDILAGVTDSSVPTDAFSSPGGGSGGANKRPKVTGFEIYELPSEQFPDGLYAKRIGGSSKAIIDPGPLPTEIGAGPRKGQKFLPLVHFGSDIVPGRFWRKSRLDDAIPLQNFRNVVESNLRLTAQRTGNPIWLDPKGSGVEELTGEPGQRVRYTPISLGGQTIVRPERIPAELGNVQPLIILLNKIDDAIERVTGMFFVQGGEVPPGVTAASALALLSEKAQKSMSPIMREWAKGWKRWEEIQLELARANWVDERIRIIAGKNKKWQTERFKKGDLSGAVNMTIDYEQLYPKSQATELAKLVQMVQLRILNPQDPEQQWRILQKFGMTDIRGSVDLDVQEAIKENERFMEWAMSGDETAPYIPELVPLAQNSVVHLMAHADLVKTDEFKDLPAEKKQLWYAHIQATFADITARSAAFPGGEGGAGDLAAGGAAAGAQLGAAAQQAAMQGGAAMGAPPGEQPLPDIAASFPGETSSVPIQALREARPPQGA